MTRHSDADRLIVVAVSTMDNICSFGVKVQVSTARWEDQDEIIHTIQIH
jgi:hypothetical protein